MAGSNIILKDLVKELSTISGVVAFTNYQKIKIKELILKKFLLKRKSIHFALKDLWLSLIKMKLLNQIWQIKKISINKNKSLGLNKMKKDFVGKLHLSTKRIILKE